VITEHFFFKGDAMRNIRLALLMIIALSVGFLASCGQGLSQSAAQRRNLRVVLYPFIPEFTYAAETVKQLFEAENPNIELSIIDLSANSAMSKPISTSWIRSSSQIL
jgi:hypothetical protein